MSSHPKRDKILYHDGDLVATSEPDLEGFLFKIVRLQDTVTASDVANDKLIPVTSFIRDEEDENMYNVEGETRVNVTASSILKKVVKATQGKSPDGEFFTVSRKQASQLKALAEKALQSESSGEDTSQSREAGLGKRKSISSAEGQAHSAIDEEPLHPHSSEDAGEMRVDGGESDFSEKESQSGDRKGGPKKRTKKPVAPKLAKNPKQPKEKIDKPLKEAKPAKQPKAPRAKKEPPLYKRGKFNHRIPKPEPPIEHSGQSGLPAELCCQTCTARLLHRRGVTHEIVNRLKPMLYSVAGPFATELKISPLERAIINQDEESLDVLLTEMKKNSGFQPWIGFGLTAATTGHNDKYAYGVATRAVALGRGNREGNNALCADGETMCGNDQYAKCLNTDVEYIDDEGLELWKTLIKHSTLGIFKKIVSFLNLDFMPYFDLAIREGNIPVAAYIAEILVRDTGYGLNELHVRSLVATTQEQLGTIRATSITKKTSNSRYLIMPIFCAALNPRVEIFRRLWESLLDRFVRDEKGSSVAFYAAINESPDVMAYLLENNVEFREANKLKDTPLIWAGRLGRTGQVELMMRRDPNSYKKRNRWGYGAIHYAAENNHIATIEKMVELGADINQGGPDRKTPLAIAASQGHFALVERLIALGAKVIKKDKFKRSPLILALRNGQSRVASLLVYHGCPVDEPDSSDNYPIHYACAYGCFEAVAMLHQSGANLNSFNAWKLTPIAVAMMKLHFKIVNHLLEYPDIDVNCKDNNGRTLISNAVLLINQKTVDLVVTLITKHNANIYIADLKEMTPLHHLMIRAAKQTLLTNPTNVLNPALLGTLGVERPRCIVALMELLSNKNIDMFCKVDSSGKTPMVWFFEKLDLSLPSYNNLTLRTIDGLLKMHDINLKAFEQILETVAAICLSSAQQANNQIVDELQIDEHPSLSHLADFRRKNSTTLRLFLEEFQKRFLSTAIKSAMEMRSFESTQESFAEINFQRVVSETFVIHLKNMIDIFTELLGKELFNSTSGDDEACSAVLTFLSEKWDNLFIVPQDPDSVISKIEENTQLKSQNQNQGGLFNGGFQGFGGQQFGFGNSSYGRQTQKKVDLFDFTRKGVDKAVYTQMKELRTYQIKLRDEVLEYLIHRLEASITISEAVDAQYKFAGQVVTEVMNTILKSTVTTLDQGKNDDAKSVLSSCQEMIKSNMYFCKKFIDLSKLGVVEFQAKFIGDKSTLLSRIVTSLPKAWTTLSEYKDLTGFGLDKQIFKLEIKSRLDIIEHLLGSLNSVTAEQQSSSNQLLQKKLQEVSEAPTIFAQNAILKARRTYQQQLSQTVVGLIQNTLSSFCFDAKLTATAPTDNQEALSDKQTSHQKVLELAMSIIKFGFENLSQECLSFSKLALIRSVNMLWSLLYTNISAVSTFLLGITELAARSTMEPIIESHISKLIEQRQSFRHQAQKLILDALKSVKHVKPVNSELTEDEYKANTGINIQSCIQTFVSAISETGVSTNTAILSSLLSNPTPAINNTAQNNTQRINHTQENEIEATLWFAKEIAELSVFTDVKVGQFELSGILGIFTKALKSLFSTRSSGAQAHPFIFSAKIQIAGYVRHILLDIFINGYDMTQEVPAHLLPVVARSRIDPESNLEVKYYTTVRDHLTESSAFPLFVTLASLNDETQYRVTDILQSTNFNVSSSQLAELEHSRCEYIKSLLKVGYEMFGHIEERYGTPEIVCLWPSILAAMLTDTESASVVYNHELVGQNNSDSYLKLLNETTDLRKDLLTTISEMFLRSFNIRVATAHQNPLLKQLLETFVKRGWIKSAHDILERILDVFFVACEDISHFEIKSRHALFYLAKQVYYDSPSWIPKARIEFRFFETVLNKASNPNIIYQYEKENTTRVQSLLDEAWASKNPSFMRALLEHPAYNDEELHRQSNHFILQEMNQFVLDREDLEFAKSLMKKVGHNELITCFSQNGFTPVTNLVYSRQNNISGCSAQLVKDDQLVIDLLRIMVNGGCTPSIPFHDQRALLKELDPIKPEPFILKHLQGQNALHLALSGKPSAPLVKYLLVEARVPVNKQDNFGLTPLHIVLKSYRDRLDILELLLSHGADTNLLDAEGESPIFEAARSGNFTLIEVLHKAGAELNLINGKQMSPLTIFISEKNVPAIELLIKLGANVNLKDGLNRNSLLWAINFSENSANSSFEIENILIAANAEINTTDKLGRTPLHYPFVKISSLTLTTQIDPIESVNSLLEKKDLQIDVRDVFGNTPLMYAAQRGSLVSSLYMVERRADLTLKNVEDNNAFAVAIASRQDQLAVTLLNNGADWNTRVRVYTNAKKDQVYKKVLENIKHGVQTNVRSLLDTRDEEAEKTKPGFNEVIEMHCFKWAVRNDWQGLAYMILSKGYMKHIGEAVFATIQEKKFNYTLMLLLKSQESTPYKVIDSNGDNLAHLICYYAAEVNRDLLEKIFRVLIKKGVSLSAKNNKGHTSLHCAAICGSVVMIDLLLENSISPDEKDSEGRSSMMLAVQNGNIDALLRLYSVTAHKLETDKNHRTIIHHLCRTRFKTDEAFVHALNCLSHQDFNSKDDQGKLPLHYALSFNPDLVQGLAIILKRTVDVSSRDVRRQSALQIALKHSAAVSIIEAIIEKGAHVNQADLVGRTALGALIGVSSYIDAIKFNLIQKLVAAGLDVNEQSSFLVKTESKTKVSTYYKMSTLDYMLRNKPNKYLITNLLSLGAKFDLPNDEDNKSLEFLVLHRSDLSLLNVLLTTDTSNQNINASFLICFKLGNYDDQPFSGLCYLMHKKVEPSIIKQLIIRGNPISEVHGSVSALAFAISERLFDYIPSLLEGQSQISRQLELNITVPKKFMISETVTKTTTPLCYAIKYRDFKLVKLLLLNGANPNFAATQGRPPAYYLTKYNLNSDQFGEFLMRFDTEANYNHNCATGSTIMKVSFDFKINLETIVSDTKKEKIEVDPLYYSIVKGISVRNLSLMLDNFPAMNYVHPSTGHTAFSYALMNGARQSAELILKAAALETPYCALRKTLISHEDKRRAEQKKLPLNQEVTLTKVVSKDESKVETFIPINVLYGENVKASRVIRAVRIGADFNLQDGQKKHNLIMLAIFQNDFELIKQISDLVLTNQAVDFDPQRVDTLGRTPIHHVVSSHKNGSYENVELLKLLAKYYDINKPDTAGFPPIYYASLQDSEKMHQALLELRAREFEMPFGVRRAPTSLIAFAAFPVNVPNFEEDAEIFIREKQAEAEKLIAESKVGIEIDECVPSDVKDTCKVALDEHGYPFDVYMTKVDVKKGEYGGNVFYRMQLLHETNRDVHLVFTRYGRIGTSGQHQLTPFGKKEEAIADFKKVFHSKSGNHWNPAVNFQKLKNKYKLVKFDKSNAKEHLIDFYQSYHEKDFPQSTLAPKVKDLIKEVTSAKALFNKVTELKVDISQLPLSRLNKPDLMQALTILIEARKASIQLQAERKVEISNSDPQKIFDLIDDLAEMTSEYYELIPTKVYAYSTIEILEKEDFINREILKIRELLEIEVAVKMLLGAQLRMKTIHPIDYCYFSLDNKVVELDNQSIERQAILEYIAKTSSHATTATTVFALERRTEVERYQKFLKTQNRKLLWHGSRTMNFLGILERGLKIAPPEAPSTGHMFGKGIYFSDSFGKSYNYTVGTQRVVLLCEVALGKSAELYEATSLTGAPQGFDSVTGVGLSTPDPKLDVVIPNGMILPLGPTIQRDNTSKKIILNQNEYIVYDEDRVKIRYMVVIK